MGHAVLSLRRNFSVKTDRWAAAVVAIDQLPRKIAGVTDTKVAKNAMSEDEINEEQRTYIDSIRNDEMLIYVYMVYISRMSYPILSLRRNFSVTTDS